MAEKIVTGTDNGQLLQVKVGSRVTLKLPENPSTGFQWQVKSAENPVLALQSNAYQPAPDLSPGSGGQRVFHFNAQSPGEITLRLALQQPWDQAGPPAETFAVTLRVTGK